MNKEELIKEWINKGWELLYSNDEFIEFRQHKKVINHRVCICLEYKAVEIIPTCNNDPHYFVRIDIELSELITKTMEFLKGSGE